MKAATPRLGVIIPAYNSSAHIAETLGSVLHQTLTAAEIIVVDDGSTDDTVAVVERVDPQIAVVRQSNAGQGAARRRGTEKSTADFLLFLDADDLLHPLALEKLTAALRQNPAAPAAFCKAQLWSPTETETTRTDALAAHEESDFWGRILNDNCIRTPGCALIRRSAVEQAGGWDADARLKGHEDWELWVRLAEQGAFVRLAEPWLKYRFHTAGFSRNRQKMRRSLFVMFGKHRARWRNDAARQRLVAEAEWRSCHHNSKEMLREAKAELAQGKILKALGTLVELVGLMAGPLARRLLTGSKP